MQSRLAKSLYLGLAALSFGAVATVATTANAASKAKVVSSKTLKTAGTKRNVQATGTSALYSKPGTVKGAKVVASKATMKKLATSKKSTDYFRAYSVSVTNRGTVYYKVVSMNGKYRGYIYGGKKATTFAGGIKTATTTKSATLPSNTTVYFAKAGTSNVTWDAPQYTQYKASKQVKNTTPFANDALTITKAATKTREGSLYYYVEDAANPSVNGWIYAKAVTTTKPTADTFNDKTDVKVNFTTTSGTTVKSTTLADLKADGTSAVSTATGTAVGTDVTSKATSSWGNALLTGTGYTYTATDSTNVAALKAAKTGDTISLAVVKNEDTTSKIAFYQTSGNGDLSAAATELTAYKTGVTAASNTVVFPTVSAAFTGTEGLTFTAADVTSYLKGASLSTLYTPNYTKSGSTTEYYTEYTLSSTLAGTFGNTTKAFYTASEKTGTSPASTTSSTTSSATTGSSDYFTNN
ncbi:hypothetical protein [Levilactobacillus fujinensis]|uniref:GW domain-containing protein n=1 Tax=Levilactobacillus fujinensis TaxID=2486024 RepID=A0ABW1TIF5_9LACO|nr:hypothetical protein [Levilactobacillus fujinensis]